MSPLRCFACWLVAGSVLLMSTGARADRPTTAFYYGPWDGASAPTELPKLYDRVVVEPAAVTDLKVLQGSQAIAYLSVGEHAPGAEPSVEPKWVLGANGDWGSQVMDVAHPGYRKALLDHFVKLVDRGYGGVFLDTLDSYQLVSKDEATRSRMRAGLEALIGAMTAARPQAAILINRGFELLPRTARHVDAVVAESLFDRYQPGRGYTRVPEKDRAWLLAKLREVQRRGIEVIVIDYRPPAELDLARATAKRIADLGFTPFVTDGGLQTPGVSTFSVVPRRVLLIDDAPAESSVHESAAYRRLAPVLEHLGLVVEYRSIHDPLPARPLRGSYQGVVSMLARHPRRAGWGRFLRQQHRAGVPLVFFGHPGFSLDSPIAKHLGVAAVPNFRADGGAIAVATRDALVGFEAEPPARRFSAHGLRAERARAVHLALVDQAGRRTTAVATTDFGGLARSHFQTLAGAHGEVAWVVDPFAFLERALRIDPTVPKVDLTTRQGLRTVLNLVRSEGAAQPSRVSAGRSNADVLRELLEEVGLPFDVDLEGAPGTTQRDRASARALLASADGAEGSLPTGTTRARNARLRLQDLEPLVSAEGADLGPSMPVAPDLAFIQQAQESYPYRDAAETFSLLETPRRLRPVAFDYHAYVVSSPAGLAALRTLYDGVLAAGAYGIHLSEYLAAVRDFRGVVLSQGLDGAYHLAGQGGSITVRFHNGVARPDMLRSRGLLTFSDSATAAYATFSASDSTRLVWTTGPVGPHVMSCNRALKRVKREPDGGLSLSLLGPASGELLVVLAGLPARTRCRVAAGAFVLEAVTTPEGTLTVSTHQVNDTVLTIACHEDVT